MEPAQRAAVFLTVALFGAAEAVFLAAGFFAAALLGAVALLGAAALGLAALDAALGPALGVAAFAIAAFFTGIRIRPPFPGEIFPYANLMTIR